MALVGHAAVAIFAAVKGRRQRRGKLCETKLTRTNIEEEIGGRSELGKIESRQRLGGRRGYGRLVSLESAWYRWQVFKGLCGRAADLQGLEPSLAIL